MADWDTIQFNTEDLLAIDLTDGVNYQVIGSKGQDMPPVTHLTDKIPGMRGVRFRDVEIGQRDLELKIVVFGGYANVRALAQMLEPKFTWPGTDSSISWLRQGAGVFDFRMLLCKYAGGLEKFPEELNPEGTILFKAADPYWYGTPVSQTWYKTSDSAYFFPFFPLKLSHAEIFQSFIITNLGDVETWPVWTITGPGSDIAIYNTGTEKAISLTGSIAANETLTIDTRPGYKVITDGQGNRRNNMINAGSFLWQLEKGPNYIRVEMSAATGASQITLDYTPRYNTP